MMNMKHGLLSPFIPSSKSSSSKTSLSSSSSDKLSNIILTSSFSSNNNNDNINRHKVEEETINNDHNKNNHHHHHHHHRQRNGYSSSTKRTSSLLSYHHHRHSILPTDQMIIAGGTNAIMIPNTSVASNGNFQFTKTNHHHIPQNPSSTKTSYNHQGCTASSSDAKDQRLSRWRNSTIAQKKRTSSSFDNSNKTYEQLLWQPTAFETSIRFDVGRTFPKHSYFARKNGRGQRALYNVLRAYSNYDHEVGYCQGLSFVSAILLLHTDEKAAYELLVVLVQGFGLRNQFKPDLNHLKMQIYQLSRLLEDREPTLSSHFQTHGFPILFSAPWFLTLFASTFPYEFVYRVFDALFEVGNIEVIFRIAFALLSEHRELIIHCHSFESITNVLKWTLPEISIMQMERIFNKVNSLDIKRDLSMYKTEFELYGSLP